MIGKLTGTVDSQGVDFVILDVGGVGYLVHCSPRTLSALPSAGELFALQIDTHVREDMIRLYGFATESEREWFRLLQSVQGVGAKVALAILGILATRDLALAVSGGDKTAVARAPGVGPKLAARIVAELKDKGPGRRDRRSGDSRPRPGVPTAPQRRGRCLGPGQPRLRPTAGRFRRYGCRGCPRGRSRNRGPDPPRLEIAVDVVT